MKTILCLLSLLIFCSAIFAQNFTEKYNLKLRRTDYFDPKGILIGYSKENMKYNRLEFYDTSGTLLKYDRQSDFFIIKLAYDMDVKPEGIKKWNNLHQRYDVLDSTGKMLGYYRYNAPARKWEYVFVSF